MPFALYRIAQRDERAGLGVYWEDPEKLRKPTRVRNSVGENEPRKSPSAGWEVASEWAVRGCVCGQRGWGCPSKPLRCLGVLSPEGNHSRFEKGNGWATLGVSDEGPSPS